MSEKDYNAGVVKLADTPDLDSGALVRESSSLSTRTSLFCTEIAQ